MRCGPKPRLPQNVLQEWQNKADTVQEQLNNAKTAQDIRDLRLGRALHAAAMRQLAEDTLERIQKSEELWANQDLGISDGSSALAA